MDTGEEARARSWPLTWYINGAKRRLVPVQRGLVGHDTSCNMAIGKEAELPRPFDWDYDSSHAPCRPCCG